MLFSSIISKEEIEQGESSKFWQAILMLAEEWVNDIHFEMEDRDGGNDLSVYKRLTGNIETARRIAMIPQMLKDHIDIENEEAKYKPEEEED